MAVVSQTVVSQQHCLSELTLPSHLIFFLLHSSQALLTRLLFCDAESEPGRDCGSAESLLMGDLFNGDDGPPSIPASSKLGSIGGFGPSMVTEGELDMLGEFRYHQSQFSNVDLTGSVALGSSYRRIAREL